MGSKNIFSVRHFWPSRCTKSIIGHILSTLMTNLSLAEGFLCISLVRDCNSRRLCKRLAGTLSLLGSSYGAHMLGLYGRRGDLVALNYCSSDNEIKITTKDKPIEERAGKRGHHFAALQESTKCGATTTRKPVCY